MTPDLLAQILPTQETGTALLIGAAVIAYLIGCIPFAVVVSKAYGLAGLRVGFAITSAPVADLMNRVRQPFNVNSLAQAAAVAALDDAEFLAETVKINTAGMQQIIAAFDRLGVSYIPSFGNFITFHCQDAAGMNRFMLEKGVIVRPLAGYKMPNTLRVSIGLPQENARFIEVLEQALAR